MHNFNKKFKIKALIGRGSKGEVHKASCTSEYGAGKMSVAVKIFDNLESISSLKEQFNILFLLDHNNVVRYLDFFINHRPMSVMEYADCGSLYDYLDGKRYRKSQDVDIRINWMRQCAKGLTYLHSQNIIYNELNSKELLLFNKYKTLKICGIETCELLNSSEKQEKKNNLLRKELFHFGIILLEVMSKKNNLFPQKENILEIVLGNIKNYANIMHIKKLIENCTKNMAASDCFPTMEEVDFILGINRTINLKYVKQVGTGSFGQVYQSKWVYEDGTTYIVAAKEIYGMDTFKGIHREIKMLSSVVHINIASFLGLTVKDGNPVILMEYADRGSLYDKLHIHQNAHFMSRFKWMFEFATGLAYLHKNNIMHRDLKSKNLVLTDVFETLKICDFGLVKYVESKNTRGMGTYGYMAPEVSQGKEYTTKCDVYSFGIVLWEIMSQKKPFYELKGIHELAKQKKINEGYRPKLEDAKDFVFFDDIKTIMEKCWSQEVENRPTMKEAIDYMQLYR